VLKQTFAAYEVTYTGMWGNGSKHGRGKEEKTFLASHDDGKAEHKDEIEESFEGDYLFGLRNGQGVLIVNNKTKGVQSKTYGTWQAGKKHGVCIEFKEEPREGAGSLTYQIVRYESDIVTRVEKDGEILGDDAHYSLIKKYGRQFKLLTVNL
jgi:hypothetical protein